MRALLFILSAVLGLLSIRALESHPTPLLVTASAKQDFCDMPLRNRPPLWRPRGGSNGRNPSGDVV